MKVKPVALDAIAEVIAENIVGERPATSLDVAGPEIKTLWDMTEKVRRRGIVQVPLLPPGTTWRASRDGRLVPDPKVAEIGHTSPNGLQHEASDIQRTARKRDPYRDKFLPQQCGRLVGRTCVTWEPWAGAVTLRARSVLSGALRESRGS